ncbi:MAG: zinc ribbon domain-containing protein [Acidobacteria bacterium]|jgi:putative FmdB family regulatory protein|nr:zinc ribbon domain-containing protein [Acidobacteriota bacterium]
MPLYEYVCRDCETGFETLVRRFGDEVACPSCSSVRVDKQLSVFAVASTSPSPRFAGCGAGPCCALEGGSEPGPCGGGACGRPS